MKTTGMWRCISSN